MITYFSQGAFEINVQNIVDGLTPGVSLNFCGGIPSGLAETWEGLLVLLSTDILTTLAAVDFRVKWGVNITFCGNSCLVHTHNLTIFPNQTTNTANLTIVSHLVMKMTTAEVVQNISQHQHQQSFSGLYTNLEWTIYISIHVLTKILLFRLKDIKIQEDKTAILHLWNIFRKYYL